MKVERHTWLNTLVGILDAAFSLSEEELYFTTVIVKQLLEGLRIPERGGAGSIVPTAVAQEAHAGVFSTLVNTSRDAGLFKEPRGVEAGDTIVTLEAWRQALLGLITTGFPDLEPVEVVWATSTIDELLLGLGVPNRAAAYFPAEVVRAHTTGA